MKYKHIAILLAAALFLCALAAHLGAGGLDGEALVGNVVQLADRQSLALVADGQIHVICTSLGGRRGGYGGIAHVRGAGAALFRRRSLLRHGGLFLLIVRRVIRHAGALLDLGVSVGYVEIDGLDGKEQNKNQINT